MAKSNITLPPNRKEITVLPESKADEKKISEIINKGGRPTKTEEPVTEAIKNFNIKILASELESINDLRAKRPKLRTGKQDITLHDWILEAVKEKIEREREIYYT